MLEQLIKEQIDPNPTLRNQLVSAILLGGNVLVPEGQDASVAPSRTSPPARRRTRRTA